MSTDESKTGIGNTEELARELEDWYRENFPVPLPYHEFPMELVPYVQRKCIEARIEGGDMVYENDPLWWQEVGKPELKSQLEANGDV